MASPPENTQVLREAFESTRDLFVAFGDRHRQDIVLVLADGADLTVREVAERIGLSRPATSHHLRILREAGLLGERREGRRTYYHPTFGAAFDLLTGLLRAVEETQGRPE